MANIYLLNEEDRRLLRAALVWQRNLNGPGVTNTPTGASITPPPITRQTPPVDTGISRFLAKITDSAALSGTDNRWGYAWTEVLRDGDGVIDVVNGRSGTTTTDPLINLAEMFHTDTFAWGVDTTGDDYPAGFEPRPVGGGGDDDTHKYDFVTEVTQVTDINGTIKFHFYATGSHDGGCS